MTPTKRLEQEHEQLLALLAVLELITRRLLDGERPLREVEECLDLLRTFADVAHHGKEERHLFPALIDAGLSRRSGPVAVMLLEHDAGRCELTDMSSALIELGCGVDEGAGRFARAASRYALLLRDHIEKENDVLFPIACELLSPGAADALELGYAAVDLEVFGPHGYDQACARIAHLVARCPRAAGRASDEGAIAPSSRP